MFTQCSPRLHVCKSVTHSLMSAERVMPSGAAFMVLPRWWLSAASTALKVLTTQSSTVLTSTCLSIHSLDRDLLSTCHVPISTVLGTRGSW